MPGGSADGGTGSARRDRFSREEHVALSRDLHDQVAQSIVVGIRSLELSEHYTKEDAQDAALSRLADAGAALRYALQVTEDLYRRLRSRDAEGRSEAAPWPPSPGDPAPMAPDLRAAVDYTVDHRAADGQVTISLSIRDGDPYAVVTEYSVDEPGRGLAIA